MRLHRVTFSGGLTVLHSQVTSVLAHWQRGGACVCFMSPRFSQHAAGKHISAAGAGCTRDARRQHFVSLVRMQGQPRSSSVAPLQGNGFGTRRHPVHRRGGIPSCTCTQACAAAPAGTEPGSPSWGRTQPGICRPPGMVASSCPCSASWAVSWRTTQEIRQSAIWRLAVAPQHVTVMHRYHTGKASHACIQLASPEPSIGLHTLCHFFHTLDPTA